MDINEAYEAVAMRYQQPASVDQARGIRGMFRRNLFRT